jgi:hypothetical protein
MKTDYEKTIRDGAIARSGKSVGYWRSRWVQPFPKGRLVQIAFMGRVKENEFGKLLKRV